MHSAAAPFQLCVKPLMRVAAVLQWILYAHIHAAHIPPGNFFSFYIWSWKGWKGEKRQVVKRVAYTHSHSLLVHSPLSLSLSLDSWKSCGIIFSMKASAWCSEKIRLCIPWSGTFQPLYDRIMEIKKRERDRRSDMNKEIRRVKWGIISALGTPHVCLNTFAASF